MIPSSATIFDRTVYFIPFRLSPFQQMFLKYNLERSFIIKFIQP